MLHVEVARLLTALAGGALIGLAASVWLLALGEIAGISGIVAGCLPGAAEPDKRALRAAFVLGMIGTGFVMKVVAPSVFGPDPGVHHRDLTVMAVAGLLVGIGTRVGGGCTSGHGVCGLSRGSARSLVATMTFMAVAAVTIAVRRALGVAVTRGPDRLVFAAVVGAVFALGLGMSGMTDPGNVLGFLDVAGGAWNPMLAFVMGGALLVHAPVVRIARGRPKPRFADRFDWPTRRAIDGKLVAGAAVFGVGWGLSGYCPGPALVGAASLYPRTLVFVAALAVGAMIGGAFQKK